MPICIFSLDITRFAFANVNHFRVIRESILKLIRKIFVKYMHACVLCVFSKIFWKNLRINFAKLYPGLIGDEVVSHCIAQYLC